MIAFRQVDGRYPFLWESAAQPAGRWHGEGEGPAHYFADTPDAAWAEFLRHEEIYEEEDLRTIRRQMWAVEIGGPPTVGVHVTDSTLSGGPSTYAVCQEKARRLRRSGTTRMAAPSAALMPGLRSGVVIVVFGPPDEIVGWLAADAARPAVELLDRVRHYGSS
jgi:RES domain